MGATLGEMVYLWKDPAELSELPPDASMVEILRDRWWIMSDEGTIAFYQGRTMPREGREKYNMPQCNTDRRITDKIIETWKDPTIHAEFIPVIYVKHNCSDYH